MSALIEFVPNFSEGRDRVVLEDIAAAIASAPGARVLEIDADLHANRAVITCFAPPEAIVEAAARGVAQALTTIDMRRHHGVHPRLGAADVLPFVPWQGVTMHDAVLAAQGLGARVGALGVPGWFYGAAATAPHRRLLHEVRRGEWEGLAEKLLREPPDFGPNTPHPTGGGAAIGARDVLIAFNLCLNTQDVRLARRLARSLRELAGGLPAVRAIGWWHEGYGCAQVSTNLVDWRVTPPHVVVERLKVLAGELGLEVTGAELIGLLPLGALVAAADHYAPADSDAEARLHAAVSGLGLSQIRPFHPRAKVIQWALGGSEPL